jgi:hypothetical protein
VFRAYVEPELLAKGLGPRDLTLVIDRYDTRDGGTWRYVPTDAEGRTLVRTVSGFQAVSPSMSRCPASAGHDSGRPEHAGK